MALTRVLLIALCASTASHALPIAQQPVGVIGSDGVFQAYTPGNQYSNGQQILQIRSPQRLVLAKPGQLRSNQAQVLKRVRVQPQQQQQQQVYYAAESPVNIAEALPVIRNQPQAEATYVQQQHPQQPQYYVQRSPTQLITTVPQKAVKSGPKQQQLLQEETEEEQYPPDLNPSYNFSFDVKDDDLTNYQNRQEERDGNVVKGSYSVIDPDGYVRTVTYTADSKNGFQAKVTREPTDVKIKFPEATPAPVEEQQPQSAFKLRAAPAIRQQQQTVQQYPQYNQQVVYQQQPQQYAGTEPEPTYVLRRIPGSGNAQRLVKVVRQ